MNDKRSDLAAPALIADASNIKEVTGRMRARNVRELLSGSGIDPRVQKILETLCENQHEDQKQLAAMAGAIAQMADIVSNFVGVAENMKKTIENLRKGEMVHPELGSITQ